jgi:hypothetical protein
VYVLFGVCERIKTCVESRVDGEDVWFGAGAILIPERCGARSTK